MKAFGPTSPGESRLGMPPENASDELVGKTFADGYQVLEVLGTGGSSTVYRAHYDVLDQDVALKIIRVDRGTSANLVRRLKTEARNSSKLQHPNIAGVTRIQMTAEGVPFLVSELANGVPLNDVFAQRGLLNEKDFFRIFDGVLDGMEHAHAHGVVHCDLKPSNIIVQFDGTEIDKARIVDFGISKSITPNHKDSLASTPGGIFGTPAYMSPEQCRGEKPGARADIYSLACMMYEALAGRTVFTAESIFDMLQHHISTAPQRFSQIEPPVQVAANLENAILSALAKDPRDRPQSMSEFRDRLHGQLATAAPARFLPQGSVRWLVIGVIAIASFLFIATMIGHSIQIGVLKAHLDSAEPDQKHTRRLPSTAAGLNRMGAEFDRARLVDEAIDVYRLGNDLANRENKTDSHSLGVRFEIKDGLAEGLRKRQYYQEEEKILEEKLALAQRYGADRLPGIFKDLSDCATTQKKLQLALQYAQRAADAAEEQLRILGDIDLYNGHRQAGEMLRVLAHRAADLEQFDKAHAALRKAILHDDLHVLKTQRLIDLRNVAEVYSTMGDMNKALAAMTKYMNLAKTINGNNDDELDEVAVGYERLGEFQQKTGDYAGAVASFAKSVEISKDGDNEAVKSLLALRLFKQASCLFQLRRDSEGEKILAESEKHYASLRKMNDEVDSAASKERREAIAVIRERAHAGSPASAAGP